jgi:hypothetical protein
MNLICGPIRTGKATSGAQMRFPVHACCLLDSESESLYRYPRNRPIGFEMFKISHCLDSRLTDGCEVVSPTHRPRYAPQKYYFSASDTYICKRLSKRQGLVRLERLNKLKRLIHLVGSRIRELPACNIVH